MVREKGENVLMAFPSNPALARDGDRLTGGHSQNTDYLAARTGWKLCAASLVVATSVKYPSIGTAGRWLSSRRRIGRLLNPSFAGVG